MTEILDNANVLRQRDPSGALETIAKQYEQTAYQPEIINQPAARPVRSLVVSGMGGSALSPLVIKALTSSTLKIPFEIIRGYHLPAYTGPDTLVIASSYSGNTEETINSLAEARAAGAQVAVIAAGGELIDIAGGDTLPYIQLPGGLQPRVAMLYNLVGVLRLLEAYDIIDEKLRSALNNMTDWLGRESAHWAADIPTADNYAKQLAIMTVGTTPVFYSGPLTAPLAYKWKISWNETAKNTAFWNEYSEFNHNEFMGWTSHPIEKPFAVFDIISPLEAPRIKQRMDLSDRLLSGKRPARREIILKGKSLLAQLVWGAILADYASVYTAILNNVDPVPVALIEKLKVQLADDPRDF